jgi:hypothetical protein
MTRMISIGASLAAAAAITVLAASHATAQGTTVNKRTFLTFSGAVQVPGATLQKGTYVFRIADPDAQRVWQVLDASERHVIAQFFFVRTADRTIQETNHANGKPVVTFHETAAGVPPAIRVLYYPSDLAGAEFLYPKEQAKQFASTTHHRILATDSDPAKRSPANVTVVEPASIAPVAHVEASK